MSLFPSRSDVLDRCRLLVDVQANRLGEEEAAVEGHHPPVEGEAVVEAAAA